MFSEVDHHFMQLALKEARIAQAAGDFPVGAALVVDGELWATGRNALFTENRTTAHAEHRLISAQSAKLRKQVRQRSGSEITLYSTLEPCLMCLGIAVLHRITRIVYACPDPFGGATNMNYQALGTVYPKWRPTLESGLHKEESFGLIVQFLKTEKITSWEVMLSQFNSMQASWQSD